MFRSEIGVSSVFMARKNDKRRTADEDIERRRASPVEDLSSDDVSEASAESFPASDPPSWAGMRLGPPDRSNTASAL
jgi:hypothetical protein